MQFKALVITESHLAVLLQSNYIMKQQYQNYATDVKVVDLSNDCIEKMETFQMQNAKPMQELAVNTSSTVSVITPELRGIQSKIDIIH